METVVRARLAGRNDKPIYVTIPLHYPLYRYKQTEKKKPTVTKRKVIVYVRPITVGEALTEDLSSTPWIQAHVLEEQGERWLVELEGTLLYIPHSLILKTKPEQNKPTEEWKKQRLQRSIQLYQSRLPLYVGKSDSILYSRTKYHQKIELERFLRTNPLSEDEEKKWFIQVMSSTFVYQVREVTFRPEPHIIKRVLMTIEPPSSVMAWENLHNLYPLSVPLVFLDKELCRSLCPHFDWLELHLFTRPATMEMLTNYSPPHSPSTLSMEKMFLKQKLLLENACVHHLRTNQGPIRPNILYTSRNHLVSTTLITLRSQDPSIVERLKIPMKDETRTWAKHLSTHQSSSLQVACDKQNTRLVQWWLHHHSPLSFSVEDVTPMEQNKVHLRLSVYISAFLGTRLDDMAQTFAGLLLHTDCRYLETPPTNQPFHITDIALYHHNQYNPSKMDTFRKQIIEPAHLGIQLSDFQLQSIEWLLSQQNMIDTGDDSLRISTSPLFSPWLVPISTGKKSFLWYHRVCRRILRLDLPLLYGGILADESHTGKTVSMVSMLEIKRQTLQKFTNEKHINGRWKSQTALVVAPLSVCHKWRSTIKQVAPNMKVIDFNEDCCVKELIKADIVLTTYHALEKECSFARTKWNNHLRNQPWSIDIQQYSSTYLSVLQQIIWSHIIVDESHTIKRNSRIAQELLTLQSDVRFLVTRSPMIRGVSDLSFSMEFLGLSPSFWSASHLQYIDNPTKYPQDEFGRPVSFHSQWLAQWLKQNMMMHCKKLPFNQRQHLLTTPHIRYKAHPVTLTSSTIKQRYNQMLLEIQKNKNIHFSLWFPLLQLCTYVPSQKQWNISKCFMCGEENSLFHMHPCNHLSCEDCIVDPGICPVCEDTYDTCEKQIIPSKIEDSWIEEKEDTQKSMDKLKVWYEKLKCILEEKETKKIVVAVQSSMTMSGCRSLLKEMKMDYLYVDPSVDKTNIPSMFHSSTCRVLLMYLRSVTSEISLKAANHLMLLDAPLSIGRISQLIHCLLGWKQEQVITVHTFSLLNTIDEKLESLCMNEWKQKGSETFTRLKIVQWNKYLQACLPL